MTNQKISSIILTKNEEDNIAYCIRSLQWCDEIIIVDSNSSDKTLKIARDYNAKVIQKKDGNGSFDHFRNSGIEEASNNWIFVLDADEICPKSLSETLKTEIEKNEYDGYRVPRKNYFMDRPKKTAIWPDYQLRLHRKDVVCYTEDLHDFIDLKDDAKIKDLDHNSVRPILHFSYQKVSDIFDTLNRYTTITAITQSTNYSFLNTVARSIRDAIYVFGRNFLYKRGYQTPRETLLTVFTSFISPWMLYFKKWQINEKGTDEEVLDKINDIREKEIKKYDEEGSK